MSNRYLHRVEYEKPRMFPVLLATVIEEGDLLWQSKANGCVYPASQFPWNTNLGVTQRQFARHFVGVALQHSTALMSDPVRVGTDSVFEFDCDSQTWDVWDGVAPAADATGILLEDQKVAIAPRMERQIVRVYLFLTVAATRVHVELRTLPCCQTTTTTTMTTTTTTTTTTGQ